MSTNLGNIQLVSSFVLDFDEVMSPEACVKVVAVAVLFPSQEDKTISSG